jgi:hypothetical protein
MVKGGDPSTVGNLLRCPTHDAELVGGRHRISKYRGFRLEKAQAGWDIWRGRTRIGWEETKTRAQRSVDALLEEEPEES